MALGMTERGGSAGFRAVGGERQLVVVSCYTRFDNLAHGPKGTEAQYSLYTFQIDPHDGQMVLLSVLKDEVMNPAFSRFHPRNNVLYTCTESVSQNGEIHAWAVEPNGSLRNISSFDAGGTSTCYITLDRQSERMLVVNYWDATIGVFKLDQDTGGLLSRCSLYDPKGGIEMKASHKSHVNHSLNDEQAQAERQSDPHSHAVILDPLFGQIAFVPDLGMDVIREFYYDAQSGSLTATAVTRSGPEGRIALGPRYLEFHPSLPVCYVVNELSSEVSVFTFSSKVAAALVGRLGGEGRGRGEASPQGEHLATEREDRSTASTLRLVQTIGTIPHAYPRDMNTCGRITVHASGNFVLVSNRGHDSIAVFEVQRGAMNAGELHVAFVQHTQGATPRHFQFSYCGQWLIAANQDSDSLGIFHFNVATGRLQWTGHKYHLPSPNFVCAFKPHYDRYPTGPDPAPPVAAVARL